MKTKPTKKITEFRLYPTTEQAAKIDLWLTQLKWVWNFGLSLLEESQQRDWRRKAELDTNPYPASSGKVKDVDHVLHEVKRQSKPYQGKESGADSLLSSGKEEKWNTGLSLLEEDQQRDWRTKQEWTEPSLETWQWRKSCTIDGVKYENPDNQYGLCCAYYPDRCDIRKHQDVEDPYKHVKNYRFIANMRCPDFLHSIDRESRRSVVDSLIDAWTQYRKGKKGRPRYKGKGDRLESFSNGNGRVFVNISPLSGDNALIDYPELGQIKAKGLYDSEA